MLMEISNNIKSTSPDGKVYYNHFQWLKNFLPIVEAEWRDIKVQTKGVMDGEVKGEVEVKEFVKLKEYKEGFFEQIKELLEKGDRIMIANWTFELEQFKRPLGV